MHIINGSSYCSGGYILTLAISMPCQCGHIPGMEPALLRQRCEARLVFPTCVQRAASVGSAKACQEGKGVFGPRRLLNAKAGITEAQFPHEWTLNREERILIS